MLLLGAVGAGYWHYCREAASRKLVLYGNVDQRQVELAFIDSERVAEILVEEGSVVESGQVLARQETRRLRDRMAALEAQVKTAELVLLRLQNGTRPEEIDQARAAVVAAQAETAFAEQQYSRYDGIWRQSKGAAIRKQDVEEARLRLQVANARLLQEQEGLRLAKIGPRWEDIAEADARVLEMRRNLEEARNRLDDAELKSPARAVVHSRLLEPGDMASPGRAVFSLAVLSPKWVRAYVSEIALGLVRPGMRALVFTDSHPDRGIDGFVGFISSVADFTPKTVQTEELRTSLVYEIRVYMEDPEDRLRLGMPATVTVLLSEPDA
jgi:HlyD family secretion protein